MASDAISKEGFTADRTVQSVNAASQSLQNVNPSTLSISQTEGKSNSQSGGEANREDTFQNPENEKGNSEFLHSAPPESRRNKSHPDQESSSAVDSRETSYEKGKMNIRETDIENPCIDGSLAKEEKLVTPKGKRGRPKKVTSASSVTAPREEENNPASSEKNTSVTKSSSVVGRGPGRPEAASNVEAAHDENLETVVKKKGPGRPKKTSTPIVNAVRTEKIGSAESDSLSLTLESSLGKRSRRSIQTPLRYRDSIDDDSSQLESEDELSLAKPNDNHRLDPSKTKDLSSIPKKRGRPKKKIVGQDSETLEVNATSNELFDKTEGNSCSVIKRGFGRPRKAESGLGKRRPTQTFGKYEEFSDNDTSPFECEEEFIPEARNDSAIQDAPKTNNSSAVPRKKGRPKKKAVEKDSIDGVSLEMNTTSNELVDENEERKIQTLHTKVPGNLTAALKGSPYTPSNSSASFEAGENNSVKSAEPIGPLLQRKESSSDKKSRRLTKTPVVYEELSDIDTSQLDSEEDLASEATNRSAKVDTWKARRLSATPRKIANRKKNLVEIGSISDKPLELNATSHELADDTKEINTSTPVIKRGPGRPKKNSTPEIKTVRKERVESAEKESCSGTGKKSRRLTQTPVRYRDSTDNDTSFMESEEEVSLEASHNTPRLNTSKTESLSATPRKKGRPKKQVLKDSAEGKPELNAESIKLVDETQEKNISLSTPVVKRGPGRPKKNSTPSMELGGNAILETAKSSEVADEAEEKNISTPVVKRSPGRPKKNSTPSMETGGNKISESPKFSGGSSDKKRESGLGKRSRRTIKTPGRYRDDIDSDSSQLEREEEFISEKTNVDIEVSETEDDTAGKSGRVAASTPSADPPWIGKRAFRAEKRASTTFGNRDQAAVKRRRKKPVKKSVQSDQEDCPEGAHTSSKQTSQPSIEKCPRCGESMDGNLNHYKLHLVHKHAALYTQEKPEGDESVAAIVKIIKTMKKIACPKCGKDFRFQQYFRFHLEWCGRETEMQECDQCGRLVKCMWFYQHLRDHRKREVAQQKAQEKEASLDADEERGKRKAAANAMESLKDTIERGDLLERSTGKKKTARGSQDEDFSNDSWNSTQEEEEDLDEETGRSTSYARPKSTDHVLVDGRRLSFDLYGEDFFSLQTARVQKFSANQLHPQLLPRRSQWTPLSPQESGPYIPNCTQSLPFSVHKGDNPASAATPSTSTTTTVRWGCSEGDENQATGFTGGPVRAMEWCPFGAGDTRGQVLAVCSEGVMWRGYELQERREGPGLIQFWTCGALDSRQAPVSPGFRLAFSVAHDGGNVPDFCWCPRQAYDSQKQLTTEESLQRLGLIAIATSDSDVLVYSIPTPESLSHHCSSNPGDDDPPVFKPDPTITLSCSNPKECGPCLSVSWQKGADCDFIAGGYATGVVLLWHLTTPSPLLRLSPGRLAPSRSFLAHRWAVTCLDWSDTLETYLGTGCYNKVAKMWDTADTRFPRYNLAVKSYLKRGFLTSLLLPPLMDGVLLADHQVDRYTGVVYGISLSLGPPCWTNKYAVREVDINTHLATVWDMSYSPWLNVISSADSAGQLWVSSAMPQATCRLKKYRNRLNRGQCIFETIHSYQTPSNQEEGEESESSKDGLQFQFVDHSLQASKLLDWTTKPGKSLTSRETYYSDPDQIVLDVTATSLNPNQASCQWVAAGTRAGFLRLIHLPDLHTLSRAASHFFS